jgi:SAM-dependent methyltransferase
MDAMYKLPWVQKLLAQIKGCLEQNSDWLGIDATKPQRILDYACGNGTVSAALLGCFPLATFHGIDISDSQVKLFNDKALELLGSDYHDRMCAIQGDLNEPEKTPVLAGADWFAFDSVIISFALHHVDNPIEFLKLLKARVKPGGTLVVVDWLKPVETDTASVPSSRDGVSKYNPANMEPVPGGRVWPGFSKGDIYEDYSAAGFKDIDLRVWPEHIDLPRQLDFGGKSTMYVSKATAPL